MEVRVYKTGEVKKIDIRDTSISQVIESTDFQSARAYPTRRNKVTLVVYGEKIIENLSFSSFKDFSGVALSSTARGTADAINAILAENKEVDSYIKGSTLSQKSETTEFVHNDSINNGAAVVLKTQNFKAGVEGNYVEADSTGSNGYIDFYVEVGGDETSHKAFRIYGGSLTQSDARIDFLDTTIENLSVTSLTEVPSSLGTSGQVLAVNSAGTALEFVAQSGGGGGGGLGGADQTLTADRTIDVNGNTLTVDDGTTDLMKISTTNGVQIFGDLKLDSTSSVQGGSIRLEEGSLLGSNFIELRAPLSVTSDTTLVLPDGDGTSGQVLSTNGSGTLSWSDKVSKINAVVENSLSINTINSASSPKLFIQGADGNGGVYFQVPDATTSSTVFTLPDADGSSGQVLSTNGSGALSFTTVSGGGSTNELDGEKIEYFTRSTAYGNGSHEGKVIKFGTATLVNQKLYQYTASGWSPTDANAAGKAEGMIALALGTSESSDGLLLQGLRSSSSYSGFTAGDTLYVSETEGTITNTVPTASGSVVRIVGYALGSNFIYFDPSDNFIELA